MRARLPAALVLVGTAALLTLIVVVVTGGFLVDAGPLRFSARRPLAPLLIALAAWAGAALHGQGRLRAAAAAMHIWLDRHATAVAIVLAAAGAGVGVAYGTYSAAGADAAGYVSQSVLIASGRIVRDEPLARQVGWPDAESAFAPLGYRAGRHPGEIVPTYPSGLPLALAAAGIAGGELAAFLAVPFLGAMAVLCTYGIGVRLHSRLAGLIAAALLTTSPIFLFQIVQPMSDVPATAWWALAALFAVWPLRQGALTAGATAGLALLTRPNLVLLSLPIGLLTGRRALAYLAGIAPAFGVLLLLQWRLFGNPFSSGYGPLDQLFALSNIGFNTRRYAERLLTGELPALTLAAASILALAIVRRRGDESRSVRSAATAAALIGIAVLASYLPYGTFAEWWYLRFLLPALPFAFVLVGALATNAATVLPSPARGVLLAAALTAACAVNITVAEREQAFNLWRYESRYRTAGQYLQGALPPQAVVFAVQHSSSVVHYARLPTVRWDLLQEDIDVAVTRLRTLGRHPVFLVEDWELPDLRARFPLSAIARLDWRPRADIGSDIHVYLFDPADRGGNGPPTDRLASVTTLAPQR